MATNIATMTAKQLAEHIGELEDKHRARMRSLRALMRARQAEEDSGQQLLNEFKKDLEE